MKFIILFFLILSSCKKAEEAVSTENSKSNLIDIYPNNMSDWVVQNPSIKTKGKGDNLPKRTCSPKDKSMTYWKYKKCVSNNKIWSESLSLIPKNMNHFSLLTLDFQKGSAVLSNLKRINKSEFKVLGDYKCDKRGELNSWESKGSGFLSIIVATDNCLGGIDSISPSKIQFIDINMYEYSYDQKTHMLKYTPGSEKTIKDSFKVTEEWSQKELIKSNNGDAFSILTEKVRVLLSGELEASGIKYPRVDAKFYSYIKPHIFYDAAVNNGILPVLNFENGEKGIYIYQSVYSENESDGGKVEYLIPVDNKENAKLIINENWLVN